MDKPTPKERIEHVLLAIDSIREFIEGSKLKEFQTDLKLQSAVLFQFLIIGEAIRHIDDSILSKYDYPWHIPKSFRNFIIHEYHGIKMVRIYHACHDLGQLENLMKTILKEEF
jgi:uncharacterized protein with HEPN domain